jgi:hypothetical protein
MHETLQSKGSIVLDYDTPWTGMNITVYYYLIVKFYMFYKVFFIFSYFKGFDFLVFYCLKYGSG